MHKSVVDYNRVPPKRCFSVNQVPGTQGAEGLFATEHLQTLQGLSQDRGVGSRIQVKLCWRNKIEGMGRRNSNL